LENILHKIRYIFTILLVDINKKAPSPHKE